MAGVTQHTRWVGEYDNIGQHVHTNDQIEGLAGGEVDLGDYSPSADIQAALSGAASPSADNVFATMADLPDTVDLTDLPTDDEKAALDGAATPSSDNVFATIADLPAVPVAAYVDPATGDIADVINALITAGLMAGAGA